MGIPGETWLIVKASLARVRICNRLCECCARDSSGDEQDFGPNTKKHCVCARFPKDGVVKLGIMGGMTPWMSNDCLETRNSVSVR